MCLIISINASLHGPWGRDYYLYSSCLLQSQAKQCDTIERTLRRWRLYCPDLVLRSPKQALGRNKHPDTHSIFLVALTVIFKWKAFKTSCRPLVCNSQASRWCVSETKIHTSVFQIIHYDDVFYKPRTVSCYQINMNVSFQ